MRLLITSIILVPVLGLSSVTSVSGQPGDLQTRLRIVESIQILGERLHQARFTDSGNLFVSSRDEEGLWWFRIGQDRRRFEPCDGAAYRGGALDYAGKNLMVSCPGPLVEIWDLTEGARAARFEPLSSSPKTDQEEIYFHKLSPDGTKAAFSFREQGERAELWNVTRGQKIATLTSNISECNCNRSIYAIEYSHDGKVVAVAFGGMVFLWDAATGKLLHRLIDKNVDRRLLLTDSGTVRTLLFSADGRIVITGSSTGTAKSWNIETGELIHTFQKHKLAITALALSPDRTVLATGSRNQEVKLWDTVTGRHLLTLNTRKAVRRLSFHPTGERLMSQTSTHIFIWETKKGAKVAETPIADPGRTSLSSDWKQFMMPNSKQNTLDIFTFEG